MPLRFVADENLRGRLWNAVMRRNPLSANPIDMARVGDYLDLPLGTTDPDILLWAEREDRIVVTTDMSTIPAFLAGHLAGGRHCPGVFLVRPRRRLTEILDFLEIAAYASESWEWRDQCWFVP